MGYDSKFFLACKDKSRLYSLASFMIELYGKHYMLDDKHKVRGYGFDRSRMLGIYLILPGCLRTCKWEDVLYWLNVTDNADLLKDVHVVIDLEKENQLVYAYNNITTVIASTDLDSGTLTIIDKDVTVEDVIFDMIYETFGFKIIEDI